MTTRIVKIQGDGYCLFGPTRSIYERLVEADSDKEVLLKTIQSIPDDHPLWQAAGWNKVEVYAIKNAVEGGAK